MAVKQPKSKPTAQQRQQEDRVMRARKSYPRFDRHGGYLEACAALAQETGCDVEAAYAEWEEVAQTKLYMGIVEVEDAEVEALREVQERYRRAS